MRRPCVRCDNMFQPATKFTKVCDRCRLKGIHKEKKIKVIMAGQLDWERFRKLLIKDIKDCKTIREFIELLNYVLFSISNSEEEMQEKRRLLGLPET